MEFLEPLERAGFLGEARENIAERELAAVGARFGKNDFLGGLFDPEIDFGEIL
jgi:hypothetical protein